MRSCTPHSGGDRAKKSVTSSAQMPTNPRRSAMRRSSRELPVESRSLTQLVLAGVCVCACVCVCARVWV
ncbi:MAG: hypothetical protein ACPIOQ_28980, partial [Promethearchaeia archaeon]